LVRIEKKQEPENWFLVKCNLRYFTKKRTSDNRSSCRNSGGISISQK
jgi:hypothetical protein